MRGTRRPIGHPHADRQQRALTPDLGLRHRAGGAVGNGARQFARVVRVLAVEIQNDIAFVQQARRLAARHQGSHQPAVAGAPPCRVRDLLRHRLQPARRSSRVNPAIAAHLITTQAASLAGMARSRPIEPLCGVRRNQRRVDADHFAARVEQRAAGVAVVDGRVGLDEVVERRFADVAVQRADDADADRTARPSGLPIATTASPTASAWRCRRSAPSAACGASIFNSARSGGRGSR